MFDRTNNENTLIERLRVAREHAGLSQGQVARLLKYSRPTISEIEAGRRKVSSDELIQFSKIYDVSISWLVEQRPEVPDPAVELAARQLAKLKKGDFDSVLQLLKTLRKSEKNKNE